MLPVLGLLLGVACGARAEGSKNLTPGTASPRATANTANDFVGYLQQNDGNNTKEFLNPGSPATERLYVHVEPGETVYYGVHRMSYEKTHSSLRLELLYASATGTNVLAQSTRLAPRATNNANNALLADAKGVISTPAEASIGPNYNGSIVGGYNALSYLNDTGSAQEFWLEFAEVNSDGSLATKVRAAYDIWDVTVRSATGEKPGRLYSHSWGFTAGSSTAQLATTFSLYPLIPNPNFKNATFFIKRVDYGGMQPWGVMLTANSYGVDKTTGDYKEWRKSRAEFFTTAEYKLFVNNPDPDVYPTTIRPSAPTITTSCRADNKGAIFTLRVDQAGFGTIFIDGDNNKTYDAASDRLLEGLTQIGDNQFDWDGKTDTGATMPSGNISITYSSGVGPVNFPIYDAENNSNGIIIREVRPGNIGNVDFAFWDDSNLTNFPTPRQNPYGINSTNGAHKWDQATTGATNPGDQRTVNTYALGLIARNQSNNITYNNGSCLEIAPVVLPVELISFTATAGRQQVALRWATASEKNSACFVVERSLDGQTFAAIGRVAAQGNTTSAHTYSFLDPAAELSGRVYYRLRQLDLDQTAHLSQVLAVQLATAPGTLYPNPATREVILHLPAAVVGEMEYTILSAAGQVVRRGQTTTGPELRIPVADLPANALYLLRIGPHTYRFSK